MPDQQFWHVSVPPHLDITGGGPTVWTVYGTKAELLQLAENILNAAEEQ